MRLAQVVDGVVRNVIDCHERPDWAADWPEVTDAGPGWAWDGSTATPPAEAEVPVPAEVTVLQAMIVIGAAKWAEAEAIAADPAMPWAMRAAIARGATQLVRRSETMDALAWLLGYDAAQVDDLFRVAAEVQL